MYGKRNGETSEILVAGGVLEDNAASADRSPRCTYLGSSQPATFGVQRASTEVLRTRLVGFQSSLGPAAPADPDGHGKDGHE